MQRRRSDAAPSIAHLAEDYRRYVPTQARKQVDALQARTGRRADAFIRPGDPVRVVCDTTKEFGADLLVIGRHDESGIAGSLLHNAFAILRESACPVMSV
jgi:nucleotide-binding universal stress UspA family protein